jgi:putative ABC transport system substrate-binding protein
MKRRVLIGGMVAAWPFLARGQQPAGGNRIRLVGFVGVASEAADASLLMPFRRALADLGYVEGRTLRLEARYADGDIERAQAQFAELVKLPVDVFLTPGPAAARTVVRLTSIPVVAIGLPDRQSVPGLYDSLTRPGGSVTGFSAFGEDMSAKRIQLLKEALPGAKVLGVMHNATDPTFSAWGAQTIADAQGQGLQAIGLGLTAPSKEAVAESFRRLREQGGTAVIVVRDFLTARLTDDICETGATNGIAVIGAQAEFALAGGLFSYGPDVADLSRRAAGYVDRILKGEKAADLPIQLPTKVDLVVNLRTAKRLGLSIPPLVLARAELLIE